MWGKSSKQRKSAVRRRAIVKPLEEAHRQVTRRVFGTKMQAVMEAQVRAQKAASKAKRKTKKQQMRARG